MNIFAVHSNPIISAQQLPDKLMSKMILESAQMLSTAHRILDGDDNANALGMYKCTHTYHPCSVWVRECEANYTWLWIHFDALCQEYSRRYGRTHLTETKLNRVLMTPPSNIAPSKPSVYCPSTNALTRGTTPFAQAMPEHYRSDDPHASYRAFMQGTKHYAVWAKDPSRRPAWWVHVPTKAEAEANLAA